MIYVLLTDNDNGTALIACEDHEMAHQIGSAAIYSDGGVSAWLVPDQAIPASDDIIKQLRDGEDTADLHEAANRYLPITMEADEAARLRRHLIDRHDETAEDIEGLILEIRTEQRQHAGESDEFLLGLIHNRQHTSLDWDAGHDESEI
jgi:hypothetical protein